MINHLDVSIRILFDSNPSSAVRTERSKTVIQRVKKKINFFFKNGHSIDLKALF